MFKVGKDRTPSPDRPGRKHFVITGAARGIGRGLARYLLKKGHNVYIIDPNREELENTTKLLTDEGHSFGSDFDACELDAKEFPRIPEAMERLRAMLHGRVDCLVNNAAYTGIVGKMRLEELAAEEWQRAMDTNLTAPMLMTQALLPELRAAGGCVIHMSSTRALQSEPDNEAYSATKAGLLGLTQSMATSLGVRPGGDDKPPVRVNAILPGWIHVENECRAGDEANAPWEEGLSEEDGRWHLTGRVGRVEDVARAVEYLVESDGVTGTEMVVDGGVTRKMVYPE